MCTMKHPILILSILSMFIIACASVPITGRRQLNLIPQTQLLSTSFQQYDSFMAEHNPSDDREHAQMVRQVGERIQGAVERYFIQHNLSARLQGYEWEFNLVKSREVNAWCMPGGKVVVYEGILPIARDEAGLAVVMGHEIAHAVAEHGNERMSQGLLTQLGGLALSEALEQKPETTRQLW
ncbi:MAG TPA: M48 family metallopeptidase, partial [bacterium]|nr:M48 family metallopeptidase [bacterium]